MQILISTIIRDRVHYLPLWLEQLNKLVELNPRHNFSISVYENDSMDGSTRFLETADFSKFKEAIITSEILGTRKFGSVKIAERMVNLANARNKTLDQIDLTKFDKIISIEPDIQYEPSEVSKLLDTDWDCITGRSTLPGIYVYDSYGTRTTDQDNGTNNFPNIKGIAPVYASYNCFAVYNSKAFQDGARFTGINLNHQPDCDTVCVIQHMRGLGYTKHAINCDIEIKHLQ